MRVEVVRLKCVANKNQSVQFNVVLTGQHSGEEDVVREGDKATFTQSVKYAVLICKPFPLLGYLLLRQAGATQRKTLS